MMAAQGILNRTISELLDSVRVALGLDLGFVAEFTQGRRVFRFVTAKDGVSNPVFVGGSDPLEKSYCWRVVDGRLPELIHDATQNAEALTLEATLSLPVGAHLSVPIIFSDGSLFGTMCCFSRQPNPELSERDVQILRLFADFAGRILEPMEVNRRVMEQAWDRINDVLSQHQYRMVYQPIFNIDSSQFVEGHEALTRFTAEPAQSSDTWFKCATSAGLQSELELAVMADALHEGLANLPAGTYLSVNVSAYTLLAPGLTQLLMSQPLTRLVLELTEHESIEDYSAIGDTVAPMRRKGLRLAVDDAGAGYASFQHILQLKPDIIKLDRSLIQDLESSSGHRALASALVRFAEETHSHVVAEGVETPAQLRILRELAITKAQGYLLGHPEPLV